MHDKTVSVWRAEDSIKKQTELSGTQLLTKEHKHW